MQKNHLRKIIFPITVGSIIEWYELFLYIYWAPTLTAGAFDKTIPLGEFANATLLLIVGVCSRPFGGVFFGWLGDKYGRKQAFLLSIALISLPTIAIAFFNYESWSVFAICMFVIIRVFQGLPAGGEVPGAMCYLAESAPANQRRYYCSYTLVGSQIGQILSMTQVLLLSYLLPSEVLLKYGWRISFLVAGSLGMIGFWVRKRIHESDSFKQIKLAHEVLHRPILNAFKFFKVRMLLGSLISIFEVVGFYLTAFFVVEYARSLFHFSNTYNLLVNILLLIPITILLPQIGRRGDKYKNNSLFYISAIGTILISLPLYLSIKLHIAALIILCLAVLIFFLCIQFALLPALLVDLFPTKVRFTCIGFSFNITDGVIGGLSPILAVYLTQKTNNPAIFVAFFPVVAIIFLITLTLINKLPGNFIEDESKRLEI